MKYLLSILIFASCTLQSGLIEVKNQIADSKKSRFLIIPKGYKNYIIYAESFKEIIYEYKDSSIIYLSNFDARTNYQNIKNLGDSIFNYRFQHISLITELEQKTGKKFKILPDTFVLEGVNSKNLYWKDVFYIEDYNHDYKNISVGYANVPLEKKAMYDKALSTFKQE